MKELLERIAKRKIRLKRGAIGLGIAGVAAAGAYGVKNIMIQKIMRSK